MFIHVCEVDLKRAVWVGVGSKGTKQGTPSPSLFLFLDGMSNSSVVNGLA